MMNFGIYCSIRSLLEWELRLEAARYGFSMFRFYYKKINFPYSFNWIFQKYDLGALIQPKKYVNNTNELDIRLSE